ncbi:MAG TPA: toprim domain-containing protein, partial [Candidatus Nanoarchaeia archaeon]|nr:toprim domain-containing protein [Candidatus Nanoarchaeia archaeon]
GGKSFNLLLQKIEKEQPKRVILLLDFDRRGREITAKLKQGLERERIKLDLTFWHTFRAIIGRDVQCIESLTSYMRTLDQKITKCG